MSQQNFLNDSDIDSLINLLLRSQQSRTREALCSSIGIDPKRLSFLRNSSDSDFFLLLIGYLNEIGDKEALCKLCCRELLPIFNKSTHKSILEEIAVKLNCYQYFEQNSPNNQTVAQSNSPVHSSVPESGVNYHNQPDGSKPESLLTKIGNVNKNLLVGGAIILIALAGYPTYNKYFEKPPQLVEYQALKQKAVLVWSETNKGNIGEYQERVVRVKPTGLTLRNFIVEAEFDNPYDGAVDNWTYGFAFQENTSDQLNDPRRKSFDVWVASKVKEWRFGGTSRYSNGELSNLNVADGSKNKLSLVVKDQKAKFFVNDMYIETFDVSGFTNQGDIFLIAKEGISGKSIHYKNFRVWSLDNFSSN
ncbi:hypothetical protein [Nostoc sp. TCL26-01]|uniref:hypothetical protein n=1 Tax=Nostoc sp. TCL26-01 TaxID=2576904 RepID=UPI0015BBE915|nr:hypothetical protein [Nostoc sp. TCL26-01]QLE58617.1 hypothetical protein FD725_25820 [Nostoc sp. TCL26-01]